MSQEPPRAAEASPIESVDRTLRLVELLRERGSLSVKETSEALGIAPSTAHRMLATFVLRDFAARTGDRRYRIGPAMQPDRAHGPSMSQLRKAAEVPLHELADRLGETVQLMIRRGGNIMFVDGVEADAVLRVTVRQGDQMPAFASAGGKAILAEMSNADLEELYRNGLPPWPTSPIGSIGRLKRAMADVRRAGFGTNFEETESGVVGLGVAVHGPAGQVVAAITTAIPASRFKRPAMPGIVEALRATATGIESRLAGGPHG
ncbi:IclR family transcriptional regulator [Sinomonas cyclohexanicum]|uniref:IclR family transcriptional regulator n=1 Tax=Sinomonas cyclohexanicum TaxID=322009 RepID=A0ABN6FMR9_SINCY|nr:IclR family transcriptional regulator [Corynebacterium cyclohexanicum]BCT78011.1 IclR family transcriptional regulator [Corynebacterium cyclohexanicum]